MDDDQSLLLMGPWGAAPMFQSELYARPFCRRKSTIDHYKRWRVKDGSRAMFFLPGVHACDVQHGPDMKKESLWRILDPRFLCEITANYRGRSILHIQSRRDK